MSADYSYQAPPSAEPPDGFPSNEARTWAMLCHVASFAVYVTGFGGIVGPLIVWLIKKEDHPFIDEHGKEAINFNISIFIWSMICVPLIFCALIGLFLLSALGIVHIVLTIIAAIKASNGEPYRYPMTIRFVN